MAESNTPKEADLRRSILMGSEVEYDFTCHPCGDGGRILEAEGYCLDCCVYLCAQCINYHKTLPALAHHQLLDKENMPNQQDPPPVKVGCTERCQIHKDKIVEYFCPAHKVLGCSVCITMKHKLCKDVAYIPEVVTGLEDSQDYKEFKAKLDELIQKSKDTVKYSKDRLKSSDENYVNIIQEIEAYKQEIIEILDRLMNDIKEQANQVKAKNTAMMNSLETEGNHTLVELESMSKDIKEYLSNKQYSQLFINMKSNEKKLAELEEKLKEMDKTSAFVSGFLKNPEFQKMMEIKDALGTLKVRNPMQIRAYHVTDINVKSKSNKITCRITGVALLSPSTIVTVDRENRSVKLIDIDNKKVLSELKVEDDPWNVTKTDHEHVAVTILGDKKILFLKYVKGKGLTVVKEIKVTAKCCGIASIQDKLVVLFVNPPEVRILSVDGNVLQTFATDDKGERLFKYTNYIDVNAYTQSIYVSDYKQNSVTMLNMNGKVKTVYEDDELKHPRGLAVDPTGLMYLCGWQSNNIHILDEKCRKVKILLTKTDGLKQPQCVCYCYATRRLYVGMSGNDTLKVYQLA